MKEARIICPVYDNSGNHLGGVHAMLRTALAQTFGGYTEFPGKGGWTPAWGTPGGYVQEDVLIYDVACEEPGHHAALVDVAQWLRRVAAQETVYLRLPSGEVAMVADVVPPQAANDNRSGLAPELMA